jgi:hypothetical protein
MLPLHTSSLTVTGLESFINLRMLDRGRENVRDSTLLSSRASATPLMVYDRRSALSRALYAGTKVLFCSPTTLSS